MRTQLYRSRRDSMIAGVAGGLARYLGIDSTIVRLFFVLLALGDGIGVLLYAILWLTMPSAESAGATEVVEAEAPRRARFSDRNTGVIVGAALVIAGVIFLIESLGIPWLWWFDFDILWPALLVIGGVGILLRAVRGGK